MSGLPLNIDLQQIFLHMLNFCILAGALYFILYKPVRDFMDKRIEYYKDMDQAAASKRAEADELYEKYQDGIRDAGSEAAAIREKASLEAEGIIEAARAEAEKESSRIIAESRKQGERERDRMVEEARKNIIDLVIEAERRILSRAEETNG